MITVIFTCFNRKEKTIQCVKSLLEGNPMLDFSFVILDDNSTDGTDEALKKIFALKEKMVILQGDGNSYWAGGMRKAIAYAKQNKVSDYYLLINDDVIFCPKSIEKMLEEYVPHTALVGAMTNPDGSFSYGGIRYTKGIHYTEVKPTDTDRECDTFNMNCLLMDRDVFIQTPNFDEHYIHTLADFDYGLSMKRNGIPSIVATQYVGICQTNLPSGGWRDTGLSRIERLRKKESIKGAPFKPWFYFLMKNFGLRQAVLYGFSPYVRILLGK